MYTCNTGFTLKGSATINCGPGPAWTYPSGPTSCTQNCAAPPTIGANGIQPAASVPYIEAETVTYSCSGAFSISGSATLTCTSGSWVPAAAPTCVADCAPNPIIVGTGTTSVIGTSFPVGTTLTYTSCLTPTGAQLIGTATNECLPGASWKNPPPQCKLECPRPTPPTNGAVAPTTASITNGQTYTFTCDAGYTFNPLGTMAVPCSVVGNVVTFNVPAANTCLKNCPAAPAAGANSVATTYSTAVIGTTYSPSTVATYACATNFAFASGTSATLTCQSTGLWSPTTAPVCQAACGTPPLTANLAAAPSAATYGLGATITYSCANNEKVIPQSSITSTCGANGVWSIATAPACQAVCINPPPLSSGTGTLSPIQATYTPPTPVTYTCATGSNLVGTSPVVCTAGTLAWTPATGPQCAPDCPAFPTANANSNIATTPTTPFTNGNTVVYACNPTFTPLGSLTLTCQNTGAWSPTTAPTCRKGNCN
ncbi:sushi, von Willebrand factor type A, EGF and pentraxin domain-containing protein 1-like [Ciona intestinalis]